MRHSSQTKTSRTARWLLVGLAAAGLTLAAPLAQEQDKGNGSGFSRAAAGAERDLDAALAELSRVQEQIAEEKLPLTRELNRVERRLAELRSEYQDLTRSIDTGSLDLGKLRTEIKAREEENSYVANLLDEYIRNLEVRVDITELQRIGEEIEQARLAVDSGELSPAEIYAQQVDVIGSSLDRLVDLVGGSRFEGDAVGPGGTVRSGSFALVGPVALFGSDDGTTHGLAQQQLGSLEPHVVPLDTQALNQGVQQVVERGEGVLPFDPSLGNAQKIAATKETLVEHISKGGVVMVPILALAAAALIVAIYKYFQIARYRQPSVRTVNVLLDDVRKGDRAAAERRAAQIGGPTGEMLRSGIEHIDEPKDLVEEVMYERVLDTRLRMESMLPFVAMAASAAPLLGLLGTVTGMINTFKLISVFGSGDAQELSSGISEALVTTEFGLIVAIPSLLLYAYLSRKARRFIDGMEKIAISFVNRASVRPRGEERRAPLPEPVPAETT
jgi:biopolymer transport protein ExbB